MYNPFNSTHSKLNDGLQRPSTVTAFVCSESTCQFRFAIAPTLCHWISVFEWELDKLVTMVTVSFDWGVDVVFVFPSIFCIGMTGKTLVVMNGPQSSTQVGDKLTEAFQVRTNR